MSKNKTTSADEIIKSFKDKFKTKVKKAEIRKKPAGSKKKESVRIWMKIDKTIFKDAVKHLFDIEFPHLAVTSGNDLGLSLIHI